ncbi:hypothetical protein BJ878DRAFT_485572 [Calycina marina]|uniref:Shelterin complex subunit TPP1/Est3 domain-containing protein n=1 Tax=Calycina marina TaxID=1763456 RepID=A0A9P8CJ43_9HELO|nr:hypothetical protein BJ878DRAFT_485572 [Calycina marina]
MVLEARRVLNMSCSLGNWIDQVVNNELQSAYRTRPLVSSKHGDRSGYFGQANHIFCSPDLVRIHQKRSRNVQVVEFHTKNSKVMHATIRDAATKVRATFSKEAIRKVAVETDIPFSESGGRVFTILDYYIVYCPKEMDSQKVTLEVVDFTLDTMDSPIKGGHPMYVEEIPLLATTLENWQRVFCPVHIASPKPSPDATYSQNLATQLTYGTQIPVTKPLRQVTKNHAVPEWRKEDISGIHGGRVSKPEPSNATRAGNAQVLSLLAGSVQEKKLTDTVRAAPKTDWNTAEDGRVSKSPTEASILKPAFSANMAKMTAKLEAKENVLSKSTLSRPLQIDNQPSKIMVKHATSSTSAYGSFPSLDNSGKENNQESLKVQTVEPASGIVQGTTTAFIDLSKHNSEKDPFLGMERVPRYYAQIPKQQSTLLERTDSWVQTRPTSDVVYANVPTAVLADLRAHLAQGLKESPVPQQLAVNNMRLCQQKIRQDELSSAVSANNAEESNPEGEGGVCEDELEINHPSSSPAVGSCERNESDNEDQEEDSDAISDVVSDWSMSPALGNDHNAVDLVEIEATRSHDKSPTRPASGYRSRPRMNIQASFPSSSPSSDNEIPVAVPHVIGEIIPNEDDEMLDPCSDLHEAPSTLPQNYSTVQVKRTSYQNVRASSARLEDAGSNEIFLTRSMDWDIEEPHASSDLMVSATFKDGSSLRPPGVTDQVFSTNSNSPSQYAASSGSKESAVVQSGAGEPEGPSDPTNGGIASHAKTKLNMEQKSPITPWEPPGNQIGILPTSPVPKPPSSPGRGIELSGKVSPIYHQTIESSSETSRSTRMTHNVAQIPSLKRDASAMIDLKGAPAASKMPRTAAPVKRRKLKSLGSDSDADDDEDQPFQDINEMVRAERCKYKAMSITLPRLGVDIPQAVPEDQSGSMTLGEISDSLESSEELRVSRLLQDAADVAPLLELGEELESTAHKTGIHSEIDMVDVHFQVAEENPSNFRGTQPTSPNIQHESAAQPEPAPPVRLTHAESLPNREKTVSEGFSFSKKSAKSSDSNLTYYDRFIAAYPSFGGSQKRFTDSLAYLNYLSQVSKGKGSFLRRYLWDDFIRALQIDYVEYIRKIRDLKATNPKTEIMPGLGWYNDQEDAPIFTKSIITPENLQDALVSLDQDEVAAALMKFQGPPKAIDMLPISQASTPIHAAPDFVQLKGNNSVLTASRKNPETPRNSASSINAKMTFEGPAQLPSSIKPRTSTEKPFFETHRQIQPIEFEDDDDETQSTDEEYNEPEIQVMATSKPICRSLPWKKSQLSPPRLMLAVVPASSPPIFQPPFAQTLPNDAFSAAPSSPLLPLPVPSLNTKIKTSHPFPSKVTKTSRRRTTGMTTTPNAKPKQKSRGPLQDFFDRSEYIRRRLEGTASRPGTPGRVSESGSAGISGSRSFG